MGNTTSKSETSGQLTERKVAVIQSDSSLSPEEIRKEYDELIRDCPSGQMDREAFTKYINKFHNGSLESHTNEQLFVALDRNNDGLIDFDEFVLAFAAMGKTDLDSRLDFSFDLMDTSRDGYLNYDELETYMKTALILIGFFRPVGSLVSWLAASRIFQEFGIDKKEKISKQQFIESCKNNKELAKTFIKV